MRFASSREQGAGRSASGRAASMPISSLSVMPSAYTAAQGVPSPRRKFVYEDIGRRQQPLDLFDLCLHIGGTGCFFF